MSGVYIVMYSHNFVLINLHPSCFSGANSLLMIRQLILLANCVWNNHVLLHCNNNLVGGNIFNENCFSGVCESELNI